MIFSDTHRRHTGDRADPDRRLTAHTLALTLVLVAVFPLVVGDTVWSADVGAQLYQSMHLAEGRGWLIDHPFPTADPEGVWFPVHLALVADPETVGEGYVVLAKHPVLTWLVAGLVRLGGLRAVVVVSTMGTIAAAVATARLVERIDGNVAPVGLWAVGVISPLWFDGYLGYAHTLGAAAVAWATVFALSALDAVNGRSGLWTASARLVPATGLAAVACLVRTEGAIAIGALAVALLAEAAVSSRSIRPGTGPGFGAAAGPAALGIVVGSAALATVVIDRRLALDTVGLANPDWRPEDWDFWSARWAGLRQTWLSAGNDRADLLIALTAGAVLALGWAVRRRMDSGVIVVLGTVAVAAAALRWMVAGPPTVTGMVMAFPSLFAGLLTTRTATVSTSRDARLPLMAFLLFALGVLATQYPFGGVSEWGGRYFAVGLPLGTAAALPPLAAALGRLAVPRRRAAVVSLTVSALLVNTLGLAGLRSIRAATEELNDHVTSAAAEADPGDGGRPVVVTTVPLAGRVAWDRIDDGRWLLVDENELADAARRLAELGIESIVLVSFEPNADIERLAGRYRPATLAFPAPADEGSRAVAVATIDQAVVVLHLVD